MLQIRSGQFEARLSCEEAGEPEIDILSAAMLRAPPYVGKMIVLKFVPHGAIPSWLEKTQSTRTSL